MMGAPLWYQVESTPPIYTVCTLHGGNFLPGTTGKLPSDVYLSLPVDIYILVTANRLGSCLRNDP